MEALTSPTPEFASIDGAQKNLQWRLFVLRICVLSIFFMAIWFWPVGSQYIVIPPSFSCSTATLATEKTICADPLLEKIDADFTTYYRDNLSAAKLFQATVIERELKKSEADFIAARNRCGLRRWCIERQYLYQDIRISDLSGEPHRTTAPLRIYLNHYLGAYFKSWLHTVTHGRAHP